MTACARQHQESSSKPQKDRSEPVSPSPPRNRRGRPEKLIKIDDTPLNVARFFFGSPSDKYTRSKS